MPTMIEKVSEVISKLEGCYIGCNHCKMIAKAAIEAMKELTEEMYDGQNAKCDVVEVYKAMIDAALNGA